MSDSLQPMDHSPPAHGILQSRILEWTAVCSSRGSSQPRARTHKAYISYIVRHVLYHQCHLGSPWHKEGIFTKIRKLLWSWAGNYELVSGTPLSEMLLSVVMLQSQDPCFPQTLTPLESKPCLLSVGKWGLTYAFCLQAVFARILFCMQKNMMEALNTELLATGHVLVVTIKRKQMPFFSIWSLTLCCFEPSPCEAFLCAESWWVLSPLLPSAHHLIPLVGVTLSMQPVYLPRCSCWGSLVTTRPCAWLLKLDWAPSMTKKLCKEKKNLKLEWVFWIFW